MGAWELTYFQYKKISLPSFLKTLNPKNQNQKGFAVYGNPNDTQTPGDCIGLIIINFYLFLKILDINECEHALHDCNGNQRCKNMKANVKNKFFEITSSNLNYLNR